MSEITIYVKIATKLLVGDCFTFRILNKIPRLELIEMERIKEYAYCCGAGAGVKSAFPEMALNTSKSRIREAEDTGADIIVSACPFCSTNLKDGISESGSKLKYYDISELLLMALGLEPEKLNEIKVGVT